jgi:hypothetical protein
MTNRREGVGLEGGAHLLERGRHLSERERAWGPLVVSCHHQKGAQGVGGGPT